MIVAIVKFKLPKSVDLNKAADLFEGSAPKYRGMPGLVRKYYLYGQDGVGGGCYLWESRAAADRVYTADWRKMIQDRYGAEPTIEYFEAPVIVDNATDTITAVA